MVASFGTMVLATVSTPKMNEIEPSAAKLARIIWQVAKLLVALLEKEFGFKSRAERREEKKSE